LELRAFAESSPTQSGHVGGRSFEYCFDGLFFGLACGSVLLMGLRDLEPKIFFAGNGFGVLAMLFGLLSDRSKIGKSRGRRLVETHLASDFQLLRLGFSIIAKPAGALAEISLPQSEMFAST
jgi:hypothetical protein